MDGIPPSFFHFPDRALEKRLVMPSVTVVIPASLSAALERVASARATSVDSIVTAAVSQYFQTDRHRAYQISTSGALVQGVYDGVVYARALLANGDFGLGTFERLDGEMVVLEGKIYQVHADGSVTYREDDFRIPFAIVSRFYPDESFDVTAIDDLLQPSSLVAWHRERTLAMRQSARIRVLTEIRMWCVVA
jgi:acetolactate decarboxylase